MAVELIFTILGFGDPVIAETDSKIEYVLRKNSEYTRFGKTISINSFGFRSREIDSRKENAEKRILLLGDSILYGGHHIDQTETIGEQLQGYLTQNCKAYDFTILSAAVSSWGPKNILEYLKEYGIHNADITVLLLSSHDIIDFPSFKKTDVPYRLSESYGATHDALIAIYSRISKQLKKRIADQAKKQAEWRAQDLDTTRDILAELFSISKKTTSHNFLFFHPSIRELIRPNFFEKDYFSKISDENDIEFRDLSKSYTNNSEYTTASIYQDNLHLTSQGAAIVANELAKDIMKISSCRKQ